MPQPAAAGGKRGLRRGAELVVQRRRAAPEAVAARRAPRADDERAAAGMPAGAHGAVSYTNIPTPAIAVITAPSTMATMIAQMTITIVYQMAFSAGVFITGGSPS